jgi:hypothetical protein
MDYVVLPYGAVDAEAYASLLDACPEATPFHSLDWMRIYELFSRRASPFLLCAREGSMLVAAMPVTVIEKFFVRAVFSSGFGVHGGPICRPGFGSTALPGLLRTFVRHFNGPRTVLSSVRSLAGLADGLSDFGFSNSELSTHVMSIPSSYEALRQRIRTDTNELRRSARAGVSVARSSDAADFASWQRLCSANYVAHGRRPYPSALYRAVARRIRETDTLRFYVAKAAGRVVGGSVQVFALGKAYYWMSATDAGSRSLGVNDAVLDTVLREAIQQGLGSYDFGPSPSGAKGLTRFKEKWGGVRRDYRQFTRSNLIGRVGAQVVRRGVPTWRFRPSGDGD